MTRFRCINCGVVEVVDGRCANCNTLAVRELRTMNVPCLLLLFLVLGWCLILARIAWWIFGELGR